MQDGILQGSHEQMMEEYAKRYKKICIENNSIDGKLNDYMSIKYPDEFAMAEKICDEISGMIKHKLNKAEIGYLAMHICRVTSGELEAEE